VAVRAPNQPLLQMPGEHLGFNADILRPASLSSCVTRAGLVPDRQLLDWEYSGPDMKIEIEQDEDGRWIAEVPDLSGAMTYGQTRDEAVAKVKALALRVLADRLEHGEMALHEANLGLTEPSSEPDQFDTVRDKV